MDKVKKRMLNYTQALRIEHTLSLHKFLDKNIAPTLPISVVIPALNAADYLSAAIGSVQAQTCLPTEILVIDDGSTDGTAELARSLGVRVVSQTHAGVSAARNRGARLASSKWVAFLDADDTWAPTKLEKQWYALEAVPTTEMCFTGSSYFSNQGSIPGGLDTIHQFRRVKLLPTKEKDVFICERDSYARTLTHVNFVVQSSVIVSRKLFVASGGYDESLHYAEDLEWLLRIAALTTPVIVHEPLTRIRTHDANSSHQWDRMILAHIAVGDATAAAPERYPIGVPHEFSRRRAARYFEAGLSTLRRLEAQKAEACFAQSVQIAFSPHAGAMLWIARFAQQPLGKNLLTQARSIWKKLH